MFPCPSSNMTKIPTIYYPFTLPDKFSAINERKIAYILNAHPSLLVTIENDVIGKRCFY